MERLKLPTYSFRINPGIIKNCILSGHLDESENLNELIKEDIQSLKLRNLSPKDIWMNHTNIYLQMNFGKGDITKEHFECLENFKFPPNYGIHWTSRDTITKHITVNGRNIYSICFIWNGAERCPIESFYTQKNFSYERGDRDYLFIDKDTEDVLFVPDLVPCQGAMFGFYQGKKSPYRLDPIRYINFFRIQNTVERIPFSKIKSWVPTVMFYKFKPLFKFSNTDYDIFLYNGNIIEVLFKKKVDFELLGSKVHYSGLDNMCFILKDTITL